MTPTRLRAPSHGPDMSLHRALLRPIFAHAALITASALIAGGCPCKRNLVSTPTPTPTPAAPAETQTPDPAPAAEHAAAEAFAWQADRFADVKVLRYQIPGFEALPLRDKVLCYHLHEAALAGRDILWAQHYRHNLQVRRTLEAIFAHEGAAATAGADWDAFVVYAKRVFFSSGIHHHYSTDKFEPGFAAETFGALVRAADPAALPLREGQDVEGLVAELTPLLFDASIDPVRVNQAAGTDMVAGSANNFYAPGLTQAEVEAFYEAMRDPADETPVSHGLNSRLARDDSGQLVEQVWKVGGLYGAAIERVVAHLEQALAFAESEAQRKPLELLIAYYRSGDLATFDAYNIAWLADTGSNVDVINGFIETYGDPLGFRATYESVVSIRDMEASRRIAAIAAAADWFEAHSPIADAHKKEKVTGIDAKVITVVAAGGDTSPTLPLGINLPNADWIRANHGSKSVNLGNIAHAHHEASRASGLLEAFSENADIVARARKHGALADALHTDMHEVIGHASGQLEPNVPEMHQTLQNYSHVLEEARADLVAMYYLMDPKLIELGVMDSLDVGRTAYDDYLRNGLLVQLARVELGQPIQQAHMRNRHMISSWIFERGKATGAVERVDRDGKTYFVIRDHDAVRGLFGELLREVQRIKSQGDYEAGKALVETYGVQPDPEVHRQVRERYAALDLAPYTGFINPVLTPVRDDSGAITDVTVSYPDDFLAQMLDYSARYSTLPTFE